MTEYAVIFELGENNWSAYVPDLPGCIATGSTQATVAEQIRAAIEFHIEGLRLHGESVPSPTSVAGIVSVMA